MRVLRLAVAVATTALLGLLAPSVAQVGTLTQIPPMLSGASGTEFGASTAFNGVSVTCMHACIHACMHACTAWVYVWDACS